MGSFSGFFDTPWKVAGELRRLLGTPVTLGYCLLCGVRVPPATKFYGRPLIQRYRGSRIIVGRGVVLRSRYASNPLGVRRSVLSTMSRDAVIEIGDEVKASGLVVVAKASVRIGHRTRIGVGTTIVDTDFHPTDAGERSLDPRDGASAPVVIGNDVFLGMDSRVLKGVTVGDRSVVGAGAVVRSDVPPDSVVAGNPAEVIWTRG